ncbi:MAG: SAM-dependent methyltransferase [Candidatus Marinimicrobia bacterium]|nr:SAM-dependent methyltransferase [Candidatus Neomarinimicrobiota bacterium]
MKTLHSLNKTHQSLSLLRYTVFVFIITFITTSTGNAQKKGIEIPYVPTPMPVVKQMLHMADVGSTDYLIDLGSGDGRVVIAAAKMGAVAHGVDINPVLNVKARRNASEAGVRDRVIFLEKDLFYEDISRASVVTMYLLPSINLALRPILLEQLTPGTRLVSHSFDMGGWKPDKWWQSNPDSTKGRMHPLYMWIIPAEVSGDWSWSLDGSIFSANISQEYQNISVSVQADGNTGKVLEPKLKGERIRFRLDLNDEYHLYSGALDGNEFRGTVQIYRPDTRVILPWEAYRE